MNDLMQKLAVAKKIMEVHDKKQRGGIPEPSHQESLSHSTEQNIKYNIPTLQETKIPKKINEDSIIKSKLPDEIKKLMIENPIDIPNINGPILSEDIIEGASRLMGNNTQQPQITETFETKQQYTNPDIKQMIRDTVRDTLRDVLKEELKNAGLLSETTKKTNEIITIKVGSHIFEGTIQKIKKVK
jgi:hypothetical protein